MCIFSLEIYEIRYNISRENHLLSESYVQKSKEYCFTRLNTYINDNVETLSFESIITHFDSIIGNNIVTYEDAQIVYNSKQQWFELITPYEECFHRKDIYKFNVENNSVIYEYFKTEYY
jgi:hypothetical protein